MAEYCPPTEDLPMFNNDVFVEDCVSNGNAIGYLQYPIAQGDETLQGITVNGISNFLQKATFQDIETNSTTDIKGTANFSEIVNINNTASYPFTINKLPYITNYADTPLVNNLITKYYADNTYTGTSLLTRNNVWYGTNDYLNFLPTSSLNPSNSYHLTNKSYVDTTITNNINAIFNTEHYWYSLQHFPSSIDLTGGYLNYGSTSYILYSNSSLPPSGVQLDGLYISGNSGGLLTTQVDPEPYYLQWQNNIIYTFKPLLSSTTNTSLTELISVNRNISFISGGSTSATTGKTVIDNDGTIRFFDGTEEKMTMGCFSNGGLIDGTSWNIANTGRGTFNAITVNGTSGLTVSTTGSTINFGTNAPTMSGANIASGTIPIASLATSIPTFGGTNNWTGTNTFNTNLPTSTQTPTNITDLTTKTYVDTSITNNNTSLLASPNTWSNTNTYTGTVNYNSAQILSQSTLNSYTSGTINLTANQTGQLFMGGPTLGTNMVFNLPTAPPDGTTFKFANLSPTSRVDINCVGASEKFSQTGTNLRLYGGTYATVEVMFINSTLTWYILGGLFSVCRTTFATPIQSSLMFGIGGSGNFLYYPHSVSSISSSVTLTQTYGTYLINATSTITITLPTLATSGFIGNKIVFRKTGNLATVINIMSNNSGQSILPPSSVTGVANPTSTILLSATQTSAEIIGLSSTLWGITFVQ